MYKLLHHGSDHAYCRNMFMCQSLLISLIDTFLNVPFKKGHAVSCIFSIATLTISVVIMYFLFIAAQRGVLLVCPFNPSPYRKVYVYKGEENNGSCCPIMNNRWQTTHTVCRVVPT